MPAKKQEKQEDKLENQEQQASPEEQSQVADPQEQTTPTESKAQLSEAQMDSVSMDTGSELSGQPKKSVTLYQHPETSTEQRLPDETVTINGYTYQIKRGEEAEVPESVYEVLRQSGRI